MYKIGELSKLCRLPVRTLRFYDSEGLLVPDYIDRFTGYRYYSAARLMDCNRIVALKELGFSLDEIRRHMNASDTDDVLALIDAKQGELRETLSKVQDQLRRLEEIRLNMTEGEKNMYDIVIRDSDAIRAAVCRRNFTAKEEAYRLMEEMREALPKNIIGARSLIINYETEYRESDFDLAVCVEITGKLPANSSYTERKITLNGEVASLVCRKDELDDAYSAMMRKLDDVPAQIVGAFYEILHDDDVVELKVPIARPTEFDCYTDCRNEKFVNDPDVLGRWKLIDIVPSEEQFRYGDEKCSHGAWLDPLYFLEGGKGYWATGGWTKGYLYTGWSDADGFKCCFKNPYTIREVDGHTLLFLSMHEFYKREVGRIAAPEIWVYELEEAGVFHEFDVRRKDITDLPFTADEKILGTWSAVDFFVEAPDDYDPKKKNWRSDDLFLKKLHFSEDGRCMQEQANCTRNLRWTKGLVLDDALFFASAYEIRVIDGTEYLIFEWKSGDYAFDSRVYWYILARA